MIRINKPDQSPKSLSTKGTKQTRADCAAYDLSPAAYRSGDQKFTIDNKIYGAKRVREALSYAQHDKCCYCEARFSHTSPGAVEHYRPKGAVKQSPTHSTESPGYYWLAYDWNNLLMSCTACNTAKGALFPLEDHNARARSHHDDVASERPLFINPALDDPRKHIHFRGAALEPKTEAGLVTIQRLNLHRALLEEDRLQQLQVLKSWREAVEFLKDCSDPEIQTWVQEKREHLAAAVRPEAEYSAMAQAFLADNP